MKTNEIREGAHAKAIEKQSAKIPSTVYLAAALTVMGVSAALQVARKKHLSLFIGQWAAPFLLFGIYNKIVKTEGHDQEDSGNDEAPDAHVL